MIKTVCFSLESPLLYRSCCPECKPYYVMILALVCGGAALLALMSLATMIPLDIGVLPKGKWPKKWSRYILTVIIFYDDLQVMRGLQVTQKTTPLTRSSQIQVFPSWHENLFYGLQPVLCNLLFYLINRSGGKPVSVHQESFFFNPHKSNVCIFFQLSFVCLFRHQHSTTHKKLMP